MKVLSHDVRENRAMQCCKVLLKRLLSITILSFLADLKITGFSRISESIYETPRPDSH
jgi:hypothetical protein